MSACQNASMRAPQQQPAKAGARPNHALRHRVLRGQLEVLARQRHPLQVREGVAGETPRREQRGVFQQRLSAHDAVDAGLGQHRVHIRERAHVAVADDGHVQRLLHGADDRPVREDLAAALVVTGAPVHGDEGRAGALEHARVRDGALQLREDPDLGADWRADVLQSTQVFGS